MMLEDLLSEGGTYRSALERLVSYFMTDIEIVDADTEEV